MFEMNKIMLRPHLYMSRGVFGLDGTNKQKSLHKSNCCYVLPVNKFYLNLIVLFLVLGNLGGKYLNKLVPALPQRLSMIPGAMEEAIEEKEQ